MIDETTGGNTGGTGSNPASPAPSNKDLEEARIIEEVIIRPPAAASTPSAPPAAPREPQPAPLPDKSPKSIALDTPTQAGPTPPPAPPVPSREAPPPKPRRLSSSALSAGMMGMPLPVPAPPLNVPSAGAPAPTPAPAMPIIEPVPLSTEKPAAPKEDVQKILGGIKQVAPSPEESSGVFGGQHQAVFLEEEAASAASNLLASHPRELRREDSRHPIKLPERPVIPDKKAEPENKTAYDTSLASPFAPAPNTAQINLSNEAIPKGAPSGMTAPSSETPAKGVAQKTFESAASIVAPLRTLKNDFQDIVRDKKMSLVRATALEQEKRRPDRMSQLDASNAGSRRTVKIVFAVIFLAVLGSAALFGVAVVMQDRSAGATTPADTSLLFAESTVPLVLENLSSYDLKGLLAQARLGGSGTLGSITRILPVIPTVIEEGASPDTPLERPATFEEFLRAINARVSPDLLRALDTEFFFGLHTVDENAPLFVIPVLSYERAFADMLEWEETMNADLAPAFTTVSDTRLGADGLLEKRAFEDLIMRNYDVRALKDDTGIVQLYYSFPTRGFLIIAESPHSFAEILSRLRAERKL